MTARFTWSCLIVGTHDGVPIAPANVPKSAPEWLVSCPLAVFRFLVETGPSTGPRLINGAEGGIRTPTPL